MPWDPLGGVGELCKGEEYLDFLTRVSGGKWIDILCVSISGGGLQCQIVPLEV